MSRLDVVLTHQRDGSVNKAFSMKELNSTGKKHVREDDRSRHQYHLPNRARPELNRDRSMPGLRPSKLKPSDDLIPTMIPRV